MSVASERGSLILSALAWPGLHPRSAGPTAAATFPTVMFPRRDKKARLVASAGPSTANYVFAFVFPLSLLAITIIVSARIGNKLDQKYLEELAINQAIEEADLDEDLDDTVDEMPVVMRTRNRPKQQL